MPHIKRSHFNFPGKNDLCIIGGTKLSSRKRKKKKAIHKLHQFESISFVKYGAIVTAVFCTFCKDVNGIIVTGVFALFVTSLVSHSGLKTKIKCI